MKRTFLKPARHLSPYMVMPDGKSVLCGRRAGVRGGQSAFLDIGSPEYKALVDKFGTDADAKMKEMGDNLTNQLNEKWAEVQKGAMKAEDFENFKKTELKNLNDALKKMDDDFKEILRKQGLEIAALKPGGSGAPAKAITLAEFFKTKMKEIQDVRKAGAGYIEFTSEEMREAGVVSFTGGRKAASIHATTIGTVGGTNGSVVAQAGDALASPYLPGLGGSDLELFDIIYNPNFILARVDVGTTNQSRLAWINEVEYVGAPGTNVAEGAEKPLVQHKFQVEYSVAKKAAARIELTEEFEDDLPGLATAVRRMLQTDVLRAFDDAIQALVIAAARPYEITGLNTAVPFATLFDAIGALLAQIGFYNFIPNTIALNPVTNWRMLMSKDTEGRYLTPPFMNRINALLVEANKVAIGYGLVGDLSQFKVDIYKNFTLRVGWVNNQFAENKFTIIGELRYHAYISDSRKKAIVYHQLSSVQAAINSGS